jgi:hypothetical protein
MVLSAISDELERNRREIFSLCGALCGAGCWTDVDDEEKTTLPD